MLKSFLYQYHNTVISWIYSEQSNVNSVSSYTKRLAVYEGASVFYSVTTVPCIVLPEETIHSFPNYLLKINCANYLLKIAVLCCGYTLTDFPISIRLTSLALWQFNDCPSASKTTLMNMDKYFMWIHYERLRNHKKAKHNKTVCIFLGIYCSIHILSK